MVDSPPATDEVRRLASTGLSSDAEVRWFTGPHGWIAACRESAASGHPLDLNGSHLNALLDDLDDRAVAASGPTPSDRARLLADIAAGLGRSDPLPSPADCARLLFGPGAERHGPAAHAAVERFAAWLNSGTTPAQRSVAVPIVVSTHDRGEVVQLHLGTADPDSAAQHRRSVEHAPVVPDLVEAPFQRWGVEVLDALADAHRAVGLDVTVWFTVTSQRSSLPIEAITGRSAGLGAAIGYAALVGSGPPIDPDWVVTGDVSTDGRVVSLERNTGAGGYSRKLSAVGERTLVLPAADTAVAAGLSERTPLIGVSDLAQARQVLVRHDRARDAYRRTMGGARSRVGLAVGALSVAGVLAGSAWWWFGPARPAIHVDDAALVRQGAAVPASFLVPEDPRFPTGGRVRMAATEVTNVEYARCVEARECTEPDPATAGDWLNPARGTFPIAGITAAQAERYCEWAGGPGWGLPTFAQMQAATATAIDQFPYGRTAHENVALPAPAGALPTEIQQVDGLGSDAGQFAFLTGNVAEWTRTACSVDGGPCSNQPTVADLSTTVIRVFGVPFDATHALLGSGWFELAEYPPLGFLSDSAVPNIGVRCALEVPT